MFYIPNNIGTHFPNLRQLEIIASRVKQVKRINFQHLRRLIDLRLDGNEIELIFSDTFWDLENLQWLSIASNRLKTLPVGLTLRMPKLLWFTIDANEIERLDQKYFRTNQKIQLISFRGNKLEEITFDFKRFSQLILIDLAENECINMTVKRNRNLDEKLTGFEKVQNEVDKNCTN